MSAAVAPQDDVLTSVSGAVATITLNRVAHRNSLTPAMVNQMMEALDRFSRDPEVRIIVLTHTGPVFCSGMDLKAGGGAAALGAKPYAPFDKLFLSPKPVVALVHGTCHGGGVGLFFACDIRLISSKVSISFPEASIGIYPALISGYITPQLGPYLTRSLMLSGLPLRAEQMLSAGVTSHAVFSGVDDMRAFATATLFPALLRSPTVAHQGVKRITLLMAYGGAQGHSETMTELMGEFQGMMATKEAAYARKQLGLKKSPDWVEFYAAAGKQEVPSNVRSKL